MAKRRTTDRVEAAALPAAALAADFPEIDLPIRPPYPPMEARSAEHVPSGDGWLYEPKWDGFRCLAFRQGRTLALQSKSGQPLDRYFPELTEAFLGLPVRAFVLDGEIVIRGNGGLDFDALLQRIHPAESRILRLSRETPATYYAFDLLVDGRRKSLIDLPLTERRRRLEELFGKLRDPGSIILSSGTPDRQTAERWIREMETRGLARRCRTGSYQVRISNLGGETAQLVSRDWYITDGNGDTQRVQGRGVAGEQPVLAPGEAFEYTSFCPLPTPVGTMHGSYRMVLESGESFEAEIAPFSLAVPHAVN